ncbi:MAG: helix-turn-helix domain-containing protein [Treponema sp.]|nr:helix-turn-helix domain-containing protein [Treponema sp.]
MFFAERFDELREFLGQTTSGLEKMLNLSNGYIGNVENEGSKHPGKLLLALHVKGISIDWFLTGQGSIMRSTTQEEVNVAGNVGVMKNLGEIQNFTMMPSQVSLDTKEEPSIEAETNGVSLFEIPLLSKEQVLRFDPTKEIPAPKAHSGEYPVRTVVPMPRRFQDYSTDLRAMAVFDVLMSPLLAPGDVAVFQATGWLGDGVYVYRVKGDLYISHVQLVKGQYLVANEVTEVEVAYDTETFGAIGRVRAVVREIG